MNAIKMTGLVLLILFVSCDWMGRQPTEPEPAPYTMEDLRAISPANCPACGSEYVSVSVMKASYGMFFCAECGYSWEPENIELVREMLDDILAAQGIDQPFDFHWVVNE